MKHLPVTDLVIIAAYMLAMILTGVWFSGKNKNPDQFTKASGKIPQWAVGISIYATFLSSNTFLGVPGKAFGSNWNSFVFSLSMPFSAWIAAKYFIPFYRNSDAVSAYAHLEKRFGPWARTYAVICFLLTQLARMGTVFFGIALSLQAMTGYHMQAIMVAMGIIIIIYTVLGGMEAVIWTEVVQAVIKTLGAFIILYFIIGKMPGGISHIIAIGTTDSKFSLGSFRPDFTRSTFWVIFFYGIFINLNNFGMDQNYVQRYQATGSAKKAAGSLWLCVKLYLPVSLLFFFIGTSLYAWYQVHPEMLEAVRLRAAAERLPINTSATEIAAFASTLQPPDFGDKVLPDFMVNVLPVGITGIIVSAILSAAMSTISSGMNASATVFTFDIYKRYIKKDLTNRQTLNILLRSTFIIGILAIVTGIAMIGVKSILDTWWQLSGIFAAGMLGLFLLGLVSRQTKNAEAMIALIIGLLVIAWMTFPAMIPDQLAFLRSTLNTNMVIVIGTLSIFLAGIFLTKVKKAVACTLLFLIPILSIYGQQQNMHPSVDKDSFNVAYHRNPNAWDAAFAFLKNANLAELKPGKYPIIGEQVFAIVTEGPSHPKDSTKWESHKHYVDLHYIIRGKETIGVADTSKAIITNPDTPDVINYTAQGEFYTAERQKDCHQNSNRLLKKQIFIYAPYRKVLTSLFRI
jgi:SSS family solute:Na+ symporter